MTQNLDPRADLFASTLLKAVRPTDSVLDVGAGAGRYTMPIAPHVARITAVEPSGGMRAQLEQQLTTRGLSNVTVVPGAWEEVEVEPHDVVFASHVLYFVPEAVAFLQKLDRSAHRAVYIFHRLEERATPYLPLWEQIYGAPRPPEVSAIDLVNLLYAIGLRANLRLTSPEESPGYDNLDDAVEDAHQQLALSPDDLRHDDRIRSYLAEHLVNRDGRLGFPRGPQTAILWWEK